MKLFSLLSILCLTSLTTLQAQEDVTSLIQQIEKNKFRLKTISFDSEAKTISFPAKLNLIEGNLEYLIVTARGKTHESLIVTDISPSHLNVVMKLLSFVENKEMFDPKAVTKKGTSAADILVSWKDGDKNEEHPINDLIQHNVKLDALPTAEWTYTGSSMSAENTFQAELNGDIAAIFSDPSAIFNYSGDGRNLDTVWIPFSKRLPAKDTSVTIIIKAR